MNLHLRATGCHVQMGSHSITFHPTQVHTPRLNPSQRPVLDLPIPEGLKAELSKVTGYLHTDGHPFNY